MSARLVLSLAAAALVGLLVADLGLVFWLGGRLRHEQKAAMRAALLELFTTEASRRPDELVRIAAEYGVALTLVSSEGSAISSAEVPLPPPSAKPGELVSEGGYEHVLATLPGSMLAVASVKRAEVLDVLDDAHRVVLSWLLLAGLVIVALGLFFQRRVVSRPLARLTDLVGRHDQQGLVRLGSLGDNELARLSRAIIAMQQELDDDRAQIRRQLTELTDKNRALAAAQRDLVRAERLAVVGQLAAGVAHEIGNPLAVLAGFLDVLKDPSLPESDRQAALGRMSRELDRIQATLRNLLDFSRTPPQTSGPGDLAEVLEHVRALLAPQERMKRVTLEVEPPPGGVTTNLGADALTQLLLNLVLNAADALAGQGRIRVAVTTSDEGVTLHVDDSGPGIPIELRSRVFEPFFTTKPAGSGTGLGLSVCERIVTSAGGRISVADSPLGGARFEVTLQRAGTSSSRAMSE